MLARNRAFELWSTALSSRLAAQNDTLFSYTGNFVDFEERVLLDEIPKADYSTWGTYFFGTSDMKWGFATWDLALSEREHLGNYGIGASNHRDQLEFIRYLINYQGFLQAGAHDLVVLGVSYHLAHKDGPAGGYWAALLRRRGLFELTKGEVKPTEMNPIEYWLRVEQARSSGLVWNLGRLLKGWVRAQFGIDHRIVHDASQYQASWRAFMGEHWQENIDEAMDSLRQTISLVRSRGARIEIVFLPQGSWMSSLPFGARYDGRVLAVCSAENVPALDLSHSLPDEDFVDSNHLTVQGQERFRKILFESLALSKGSRIGGR